MLYAEKYFPYGAPPMRVILHMPSRYIRVIVADDHPAVALGISYELGLDPAIDVIGCAKNSTSLIAQLDAQPCDVVVSDYTMPGGKYGDGLALFALLRRRYPDLRIAVLTMIDTPTLIRALLGHDKVCVLSKSDPTSHIVNAVHAVYRGKTYYSPKIQGMIVNESSTIGSLQLTRREAEIVRLLCAGATVTEIAQQSHRSVQTVSSQKRNAMKKLGIERDADLILYGADAAKASQGEAGLQAFTEPDPTAWRST